MAWVKYKKERINLDLISFYVSADNPPRIVFCKQLDEFTDKDARSWTFDSERERDQALEQIDRHADIKRIS